MHESAFCLVFFQLGLRQGYHCPANTHTFSYVVSLLWSGVLQILLFEAERNNSRKYVCVRRLGYHQFSTENRNGENSRPIPKTDFWSRIDPRRLRWSKLISFKREEIKKIYTFCKQSYSEQRNKELSSTKKRVISTKARVHLCDYQRGRKPSRNKIQVINT